MVVAASHNGVIGVNGGLPWHISSDLKLFKAITLGKPIIMGRKTWESLPRKPLSGRTNIVITGQREYKAEGAFVVEDVNAALDIAARESPAEIAVIGGGAIYRLFWPITDKIYLTEVDLQVAGDTTIPAIESRDWVEVSREEFPQGPNDSAAFALRVLERRR